MLLIYIYSLLVWHLAGFVTALPSPSTYSTSAYPPKVFNPSTGVKYIGNLSAGVESFLNIRFGEDTGGANRFALPKPFHYPPKSTVNASVIGAACPQADLSSGIFATKVKKFQENCLSLRIDRLQNTTVGSKLPVMIYLYGGGYTSGDIYEPNYSPPGLLKSAQENGTPVIYAAVK